jgi:hypothetical protein
VTAWGDAILTSLRPKARALYQAGRFVASQNGAARFALPNEVHVQMASQHRREVEESLTRHFGRPVRFELVVDTSPGALAENSVSDADRAPSEDDPAADRRSANRAALTNAPRTAPSRAADSDGGPPIPSSGPPTGGLDDFDDIGTPLEAGDPGVPTGLAWAEDRLRQAFPGAEELST